MTRPPVARPVGWDSRELWLLAGVVAVAAAIRAIPIGNDFWLDEIWTYDFARGLHGPLEVFTRNHHSNNHHLNTLFFYWLGVRDDWELYRIPALLAGISSVAIAAAVAGRHGRLEGLLAAVLVGGCFTLIHFSSEARGYSFAVFFALAATCFLERALRQWSLAAAIGFGACVSLGIASQLVFLFYWSGAVAWSGLRALRGRLQPRRLVALHALPLAAFSTLYWVNLRFLLVGSGDPPDLARLAAQTFGFGLGLPTRPAWAAIDALVVLILLAAGLRLLVRERDDSWVLHLVAILIAPIGVIALLRPEVVEARYFVIGTALALIVAARVLAAMFRAGGRPRALAALALTTFLVGNALHTARFYDAGRGGYRAALRFMAENSPDGRVDVGSDHDFRTGTVLRFHARALPSSHELVYHPQSRWPRGGTDWMITHSSVAPTSPVDAIADRWNNAYDFAHSFDHGGLSGFYWAVYQRRAAR